MYTHRLSIHLKQKAYDRVRKQSTLRYDLWIYISTYTNTQIYARYPRWPNLINLAIKSNPLQIHAYPVWTTRVHWSWRRIECTHGQTVSIVQQRKPLIKSNALNPSSYSVLRQVFRKSSSANLMSESSLRFAVIPLLWNESLPLLLFIFLFSLQFESVLFLFRPQNLKNSRHSAGSSRLVLSRTALTTIPRTSNSKFADNTQCLSSPFRKFSWEGESSISLFINSSFWTSVWARR